MKNLFRNSGLLFVGAACAILAISASAQTVVYDNLSNPMTNSGGSGIYYPLTTGTVVGNEISINGGVGGALSSFTFNYYGSATGVNWQGAPQFQVTFYANNGTLLHPSDPRSAQPSTILGQTGWEPLTLPTTIGGTTYANEKVFGSDFSSLSPLPAAFTWTVSIKGTGSGDVVGLNFFGPPTVDGGNTFNDYWVNAAGAWDIQTNSLVSSSLFGAQVVVPEPTALALSVFGGMGFLLMARRFRK